MNSYLLLLAMTSSIFAHAGNDSCQDLDEIEWTYASWSERIGRAGFFMGDFNGNGLTEVVTDGYNTAFQQWSNFWQVREWDGTTYRQIFVSPGSNQRIITIFMSENNENRPQWEVVYQDGTIEIYDPATYSWLETIKVTPANRYLGHLVKADVEGNGELDYVISVGDFPFSTDTDLQVVSGIAPYDIKRTLSSSMVGEFAVGNLDADPQLEVVSHTSSNRGYMLDGLTGELEWDSPSGFGSRGVYVEDVDDDQIGEIVSYGRFEGITVIDADQRIEKWSLPKNDFRNFLIADLDQNGVPELAYSTFSSIETISGVDGSLLMTIPSNDPYDYMALAQTDDDAQPELALFRRETPRLDESLTLIDWPSGETLWQNTTFSGEFKRIASGRFSGRAYDSLLVLMEDGGLMLMDPTTQSVEYIDHYESSQLFELQALVAGDLNGDSHDDYVIASINGIQAISGLDHQQLWQRQFISEWLQIKIQDIDGNGTAELIWVGEDNGINRSGTRLFIYNGQTGEETWRSPLLSEFIAAVDDIEIMDLLDDDVLDLVVGTRDGRLLAFNSQTKQLILDMKETTRALDKQDLNGDGVKDLVVGTNSGQVVVVDGLTFEEIKRYTFSPINIDELKVVDMNQDGIYEWFISDFEKQLFANPFDGQLIQAMELCQGQGFIAKRLLVSDLDSDGNGEVVTLGRGQVQIWQPAFCGETYLTSTANLWPAQRDVKDLIQLLCE
jgi:WD40 repeat protein